MYSLHHDLQNFRAKILARWTQTPYLTLSFFLAIILAGLSHITTRGLSDINTLDSHTSLFPHWFPFSLIGDRPNDPLRWICFFALFAALGLAEILAVRLVRHARRNAS